MSSTAWGAQRLEELLESRRMRPVFSAGNGEVEIYELDVPEAWDGRPLAELLTGIDCTGGQPDARRPGHAAEPTRDARHAGDLCTSARASRARRRCARRLYGEEA